MNTLPTRLVMAFAFAVETMAVAHAVTIDWVTVGDAGNAADDTGYGAVADEFQIMRYEFTNVQYAAFLNDVAATSDPYSLYSNSMASDPRGGIVRGGTSGAYTYSVKSTMGDKPVNYVTWFDAARVCNWLQNGASGTSSTESGAYTLSGITFGNAPAVNIGATFFIPMEDQWYKAAYYKAGDTSAGYWDYATQSNSVPTGVTADADGVGTAGSAGNFANYSFSADWNFQDGNVTSVGSNGGASAYGAFDMGGNVCEWNSLDGLENATIGYRGSSWNWTAYALSAAGRDVFIPYGEDETTGFRLARPVPVPEPSACASLIAGLAFGGFSLWRRRRS